jgi:hypothetical protein
VTKPNSNAEGWGIYSIMQVQRIQIEVPADRLRELDEIMADSSITTRKELINNALTLFEWAVNEVKRGHIIASIDEDDGRYREITMPALRNAQKRAGPNLVPA